MFPTWSCAALDAAAHAVARTASRARFAVLLAPAFLGGCYVVPIVPVARPIYRPYHGPYYGPYRGYQRGEVETPATRQAGAANVPPAHIEVASIER